MHVGLKHPGKLHDMSCPRTAMEPAKAIVTETSKPRDSHEKPNKRKSQGKIRGRQETVSRTKQLRQEKRIPKETKKNP